MKKVATIVTGLVGILFIAVSLVYKQKSDSVSVTVIGGPDGPTSIYKAGGTGAGLETFGIVMGIILVMICIFFAVKKDRK